MLETSPKLPDTRYEHYLCSCFGTKMYLDGIGQTSSFGCPKKKMDELVAPLISFLHSISWRTESSLPMLQLRYAEELYKMQYQQQEIEIALEYMA